MITAEELIGRAAGLVPTLRERAAEADKLGHLQDETIQDLIDLDLMKALTPRKFGGLEFGWDVSGTIIEVLSSGCGSAGWVVNAYLCTNWVVATFPKQAQEEIFADKGYTLGPCPMNALLGRAKRVDGGYRVTAKAPFGSGAYHSQWAVICATVERNSPEELESLPRELVILLPRKDYSFDLSTWAVLGLRGTGSATLVIDDVFVPDYRAVDFVKLCNGTMPGVAVNPTATYRAPFTCGFGITTGAVLLGVAAHGVEALRDHLLSSTYAMSGLPKSENLGAQMHFGEAAAHLDAAKALIYSDRAMVLRLIEANAVTLNDRAALRLHFAYMGWLCRQVAALVKDVAGANSLRDSSPLQRIFRDINMGTGNVGFQFDDAKEIYGRSRLGLAIDEALV